MSNVAFNRDQVEYLDKLLEDRRSQFLKEIKKDSFEADDSAFEALCDKLFNTKDLNVEKKSSNKSNKSDKKSKKKSKKRVKTGYMKWLWSPQGMSVLKKENNSLQQKDLFKLAGKEWSIKTDTEKKKYD
tara:strand:+ start:249 stop:635 length:387 start_codon:yes stop_codon:yes gene_type:complete